MKRPATPKAIAISSMEQGNGYRMIDTDAAMEGRHHPFIRRHIRINAPWLTRVSVAASVSTPVW